MQKSKVRKAPVSGPKILLERVCPLISRARREKYKTFPIDERGRIFYDGAWRSIPSALRKRFARTARKRERYREDPEFRKRQLERRKRYSEKPGVRERSRAYDRARLAGMSEEQRKERNRQRHELRRKRYAEHLAKQRGWYQRAREDRLAKVRVYRDNREPQRLLNRAIAEFRRGEISELELGRRCADAIELANAAAHAQRRPGRRRGSSRSE